jgi:hypothetical protein
MLSRSHHPQIDFTAITGVARRRVERLIALGEDRPSLNSRRAGEASSRAISSPGCTSAAAPRRFTASSAREGFAKKMGRASRRTERNQRPGSMEGKRR